MNDTHSTDDGWCGGHMVYMDDGQASSVLGPDGEPVKYVCRHVAGFDLRPKRPVAPHTATQNAKSPSRRG